MHAHRIDVLDRADDHDVVGVVAHHLQLELPPADHGLVDQDLADRRGLEAERDDPVELLRAARDAAPAAAERVGGAHDAGQTYVGQRVAGFPHARGDRAAGHAQARARHRGPEQLAVLGAGDRLVVRADQLDAEALQRAVVVERLCEVQCRLPAKGAEQGVGTLALDHLGHRPGQQRLDVGRGGELRIGHDRRRVGVHQHDLIALLAQDLAGLHAGVVELGGLPDHDRARAEDEDLADVATPRQFA